MQVLSEVSSFLLTSSIYIDIRKPNVEVVVDELRPFGIIALERLPKLHWKM